MVCSCRDGLREGREKLSSRRLRALGDRELGPTPGLSEMRLTVSLRWGVKRSSVLEDSLTPLLAQFDGEGLRCLCWWDGDAPFSFAFAFSFDSHSVPAHDLASLSNDPSARCARSRSAMA